MSCTSPPFGWVAGHPAWTTRRGAPSSPASSRPAKAKSERLRSLRQESNPHLGRTKGACLPLTLRRRDGDGRTRTDIFLVASEALVLLSYIPCAGEGEVRTGGVEPPQHEATGLQPAELTAAQRPRGTRVAGRARTGASGDHNPGGFRLHHGHHESRDDR